MADYIQAVPRDIQIPLLDQTRRTNEAINDEIEARRKVEHIIEMDETHGQLVNKSANQIFDERLKDLENSSIKSTTIFKVNVGLRESNPYAYTPKIISIGPYHKKNAELGSMEKYKWLYLRRFLQRREGIDVQSCISELEKRKNEALKCYHDNLGRDIVAKFSEMLLLDGCFVVEFVRELCAVAPPEEDSQIINLCWMEYQVCRDMVLLENQIPFFVLTMLHDLTKQPTEASFLCMVGDTLCNISPRTKSIARSDIDNLKAEQFDHLLDVVHKFCRPYELKTRQTRKASMKNECCKICSCGNILQLNRSKKIPHVPDSSQCLHIPSATELYEAGVSFINVEEDDSDNTTLFDIKFENGVMKIPCFSVEDTMEPYMRNLIAYEQHSSKVHKYFSNYVHVMNQLINSHKDVSLLRSNGIILKSLGDDKEVARIFRDLFDGVALTEHYYLEEFRKLIQHCQKPWNQLMANLRHNYFSSPWASASTVAAVTLLILTVIQTVLAFTGDLKK